MNKRKYYLKRGYFGQGDKIYIPKWKACLCKWFTNFAVYYEENSKEIWWE